MTYRSFCHKLSYSRSCGFLNFQTELTNNNKEMLIARTGIEIDRHDLSFVSCLHHKKLFLNKFESHQSACCEPEHTDKKPVKSTLKPLSIDE